MTSYMNSPLLEQILKRIGKHAENDKLEGQIIVITINTDVSI